MARRTTLVLVAFALLLGAGTVAAAGYGDRTDDRVHRIGEHREHRLDGHGDRIDRRWDRRHHAQ